MSVRRSEDVGRISGRLLGSGRPLKKGRNLPDWRSDQRVTRVTSGLAPPGPTIILILIDASVFLFRLSELHANDANIQLALIFIKLII